VQHQSGTDLRPEMLWINGDGTQRLGRDIKQQAVDHSFVVVRNVADRRRKCEDHVVILDRQKIGLPRF
jgi:hypothetical protein